MKKYKNKQRCDTLGCTGHATLSIAEDQVCHKCYDMHQKVMSLWGTLEGSQSYKYELLEVA